MPTLQTKHWRPPKRSLLANNWKTKSAELTDAEVLPCPTAST